MTNIAIDTRDLEKALTKAGMDGERAKAVVRDIEGTQDQPVTKGDLEAALSRRDMTRVKWVGGIVVAVGVIYFLLKCFC